MYAEQYRIRAVLFDFDGTLTKPGAIDFKAIKTALGCPPDQPVLEFIRAMTDDHDRQQAMEKLDRFERDGAAGSVPNAGAQQVIKWIRRQRLPICILTRNSYESVLRSMQNFGDIDADDFDLIITRDDPLAPKPSGDGIVWAATKLKVSTREVLMVGDFVFDLQAGHAAGALTALLDDSERPRFQSTACDFRIRRLAELETIIGNGLPIRDNN